MKEKRFVLGNREIGLLLDCAQAISFSGGNFPEIDKVLKIVDKAEEYEIVQALAKGGRSEVFVVRSRLDGKIYALKKVLKQDILNDPLVNPVMRERDSMVFGRNSTWLLGLHKSFQDAHSLYFLTDFIPGGDLGSLCCRQEILPEKMIRFFIGELLLALEELHGLGFMHRDIKPENVLIDATGHIKLADFGSSTSLTGDDHYVVVGTPDYIAPEILNMSGGLCEKSDLWSVGVVAFELAFGITPFYEDSLKDTYNNIMNIKYEIGACSPELRSLIERLLCGREERMDLQETMQHEFFREFNFKDGRDGNRAVYIPNVQGVDWVENFEVKEFHLVQSVGPSDIESVKKFIGFGYDPEITITQESRPKQEKHLTDDERSSEVDPDDMERVIEELIDEKKEKETVVEKSRILETVEISNLEIVEKEIDDLEIVTKKISKIEIKKVEDIVKEDVTAKYVSAREGDIQSGCEKEKDLLMQIEKMEEEFQEGYARLGKIPVCSLGEKIETIREEIEKYTQIIRESQKRETENAFQARWIIRKLQTEIRDAQSRIEREVEARTSLTEKMKEMTSENASLKEQIRRLRLASNVYNFPIKVYGNNKWESSTLYLEEEHLRIKDICLPISKIYFQDLKKNELFRVNSKRELLSFKLLLPSEEDLYTDNSESSSDQILSPSEDAAIKKELLKEMKILEGIEKIIETATASSKSMVPLALKQKEGTEKKIAELKQALEQGVSLDPTTIRYNNHSFKQTHFKTSVQTWCHVCNMLLYGEIKQGLLCKGCKLMCHSECHTLVPYSCELQQAMERGTSIILMAKQLEDKDRIRAIVGNGQP